MSDIYLNSFKLDNKQISLEKEGLSLMGNCYGIIYCAINMINGKIYIGQTCNPYQRFYRHLYQSHAKKKFISLFSCAIKKYGIKNFEFIILDRAYSVDELNTLELYWVKWSKSLADLGGYNLRDGGQKGGHSNESRRRLSQSIKKYYTDGGIPSRKGTKNSQEHIEKFQKSYREKYKRGEIINFWKNKTLPEDLKRKVSETKKRQYKNKECVNHQAGKAMKDEQKKKLSTIKTKRVLNERELNLSIKNKGKHSSPNTEFKSVQIQCVETGKVYSSMAEAGREYKISHANFCRAVDKPNLTAGGMHWIRLK